MTKLDFDNLNAPCPACGKGEQRKTPNPNVEARLRNPGPKPQYVRIHNRNPDKDPGFLNQVPTVHLEAVTWNQDRKSFPPSALRKTSGSWASPVQGLGLPAAAIMTWEFPKIGVPYFGVLIIRILLFRVVSWGLLSLETPT